MFKAACELRDSLLAIIEGVSPRILVLSSSINSGKQAFVVDHGESDCKSPHATYAYAGECDYGVVALPSAASYSCTRKALNIIRFALSGS